MENIELEVASTLLARAKVSLQAYYARELKLKYLFYDLKPIPIVRAPQLVLVKEEEQKEKERRVLEGRGEAGSSKETGWRDERLASFEDLHKPKKPIELQKLFTLKDEKDQLAKRFLIVGRAGIGKTTLSKYLTCKYAELWGEKFEWVFYIPIRNLKETYGKRNKKDELKLDLVKVISCECFPDDESITEAHIQHILNSNKVLLILDGYDELSSAIPESALTELLSYQHVVLTSRPYALPDWRSYDYVQLENMGFSNEAITEYVEKFFKAIGREDYTPEFLQFLRQNTDVWGVAHIPINLELICSLWEEKRTAHQEMTTHFTLTSLYQDIVFKLFKRYLLKREKNPIAETELSGWEDHQVYEETHQVITFLEQLAFRAMQLTEGHIIISNREVIKPLLREIGFDHKGLLKEVLDAQLLKDTGTQKHIAEKDYYFIHLTFQEFFAARAITRILCEVKITDSVYQQLQQLILTHRYNPRFQLVWQFVAGNLTNDVPTLQRFFKHLTAEPQDLLGLYRLRFLLLPCLQESGEPAGFALTRNKLLDFQLKVLSDESVENEQKIVTVDTLGKLGNVAATPKVLAALVNRLQDSDEEMRIAAVDALGKLGSITATPTVLIALVNRFQDYRLVSKAAIRALGNLASVVATSEVLTVLMKKLQDLDKEMRMVAADALRNLGSVAATPEVLAALVNRLQHSNHGHGVRMAAAYVLGNLARVASAVTLSKIRTDLVDRIQHSDEGVRSAAAFALQWLGSAATTPEVLKTLVNRLQDSDEKVRSDAADALGNLDSTAATPEVLKALVNRFQDSDRLVRRAAISALGNLASVVTTSEVLTDLVNRLQDSDEEVRSGTADALGNLDSTAATPEVLKALVNRFQDSDRLVRRAAISALGNLASVVTTPEVLTDLVNRLQDLRLQDLDEGVRRAATHTLVNLTSVVATPKVLAALVNRLQDSDKEMRMAAADALRKLGSVAATPEVLIALVNRLQDSDQLVRRTAAYALGNLGSAAATPEVVKSLVTLLRDDKNNELYFIPPILVKLLRMANTPQTLYVLAVSLSDADVKNIIDRILREVSLSISPKELIEFLPDNISEKKVLYSVIVKMLAYHFVNQNTALFFEDKSQKTLCYWEESSRQNISLTYLKLQLVDDIQEAYTEIMGINKEKSLDLLNKINQSQEKSECIEDVKSWVENTLPTESVDSQSILHIYYIGNLHTHTLNVNTLGINNTTLENGVNQTQEVIGIKVKNLVLSPGESLDVKNTDSPVPVSSDSFKQTHATTNKRIEHSITSPQIQFNQGGIKMPKIYADKRPSDYEYAILTDRIYDGDLKKGKVFNIETPQGTQKWQVKELREGAMGYGGIIYHNKETNQYVVAHRGTNSFKALVEDAYGVFFNQISPQKEEAYALTKVAIDLARENGGQISFTGHSLGGYLAELSLFYYYISFQPEDDELDIRENAHAVTFESPGTKSIIEKLQSNIPTARISLENLDITAYLSYPNLVNTCDGHIGTVYSLKPDIGEPKWWQPLSNLVEIHTIRNIIALFEARKDRIPQKTFMLDWPIGTQIDQYFKHFQLVDGRYILPTDVAEVASFSLMHGHFRIDNRLSHPSTLALRHFSAGMREWLLQFYTTVNLYLKNEAMIEQLKQKWLEAGIPEHILATLLQCALMKSSSNGQYYLELMPTETLDGAVKTLAIVRRELTGWLSENPPLAERLLVATVELQQAPDFQAELMASGSRLTRTGVIENPLVQGVHVHIPTDTDEVMLHHFERVSKHFMETLKKYGVKVSARLLAPGAVVEGKIVAPIVRAVSFNVGSAPEANAPERIKTLLIKEHPNNYLEKEVMPNSGDTTHVDSSHKVKIPDCVNDDSEMDVILHPSDDATQNTNKEFVSSNNNGATLTVWHSPIQSEALVPTHASEQQRYLGCSSSRIGFFNSPQVDHVTTHKMQPSSTPPTHWAVTHEASSEGHHLHYTKELDLTAKQASGALCSTEGCFEPCQVDVRLEGEKISYFAAQDTIVGIKTQAITATPSCTEEEVQQVWEKTKQRVPTYESLQRQEILQELIFDCAQIGTESLATTGLVLLVNDIMLQQGYSPRTASLASYAVSQGLSVARVGRSLYQGASYVAAALPLAASTTVYHGLTKTGVASERTASWCSNAASLVASTAVSWYSGLGFFSAAARAGMGTGVSMAVGYFTALGEQGIANRYLTGALRQHCTKLRQSRDELAEQFSKDERWLRLNEQINSVLEKAETRPEMKDYAVIHAYQELMQKNLVSVQAAISQTASKPM